MPGTVLNISYPQFGEPISTALTKLITALQTIQGDVEASVLGSEIQWLADFSASGHGLVDLSKVQLDDIASSVGLETGTIFFQNGELCVQTPSGPIQLTLNGVINAAGFGGITGDYGGSNPARVTYTDATDVYTFTADTNDWSDLEINDLKLRNNGNWATLGADPAVATPQAWGLGTANTSGVALVRQNASGILSTAGTVTTSFTTSGSITFSGAGQMKHGSKGRTVVAIPAGVLTNGTEFERGIVATGNMSGAIRLPALTQGERLLSVTVTCRKSTAATVALDLQLIDASVSGTPIAASVTTNSSVNGFVQIVVTCTTGGVWANDNHYFMLFSGFVNTDLITSVTLNYDIP